MCPAETETFLVPSCNVSKLGFLLQNLKKGTEYM